MYKIKMLCFDANFGVKPYEDEPAEENRFETADAAYEHALDEHKILYAVYCDPAAEDETSDEYDQLVKKKAAEYGKNFVDYII